MFDCTDKVFLGIDKLTTDHFSTISKLHQNYWSSNNIIETFKRYVSNINLWQVIPCNFYHFYMGQNDLEQVNVLIRGIISMTNSPNMTSIISLKFNKSGQICKFDYNDRKPNEIEPLLYKQPLLIRMNTEKGNLLKDTPFLCKEQD